MVLLVGGGGGHQPSLGVDVDCQGNAGPTRKNSTLGFFESLIHIRNVEMGGRRDWITGGLTSNGSVMGCSLG